MKLLAFLLITIRKTENNLVSALDNNEQTALSISCFGCCFCHLYRCIASWKCVSCKNQQIKNSVNHENNVN